MSHEDGMGAVRGGVMKDRCKVLPVDQSKAMGHQGMSCALRSSCISDEMRIPCEVKHFVLILLEREKKSRENAQSVFRVVLQSKRANERSWRKQGRCHADGHNAMRFGKIWCVEGLIFRGMILFLMGGEGLGICPCPLGCHGDTRSGKNEGADVTCLNHSLICIDVMMIIQDVGISISM